MAQNIMVAQQEMVNALQAQYSGVQMVLSHIKVSLILLIDLIQLHLFLELDFIFFF